MNATHFNIESIARQAQIPLIEFAKTVSLEIKLQKVALAALSFLSASLACVLVAFSLVGMVSLSTSLISFPLIVLAYLSFQSSFRIKDYEDPLELQRMKELAKSMNFLDLVEEHQGIEPILSHNILDLLELRSKFLLQHAGKELADLMQEVTLFYIGKYNLMTKGYLRGMFYEELSKKIEINDLYNTLEDMGMNELKRFDVISIKEYEDFESLLAKEDELASWQRATLLQINSQFLGRRESILADLEMKEKKAKEDLQTAHSQKKPTLFSVVRSLQGQLRSIHVEKNRMHKELSIGKDLQKEYEEHKEINYQEYKKRKKVLQKEFEAMKFKFPLKLL